MYEIRDAGYRGMRGWRAAYAAGSGIAAETADRT